MDLPDFSISTEGTNVTTLTPLLYNDVFTTRWASTSPGNGKTDAATWAPFSRLPIELRLHIWLLGLQQHRMIELDIHSPANENATTYPGDASQSRYYTRRNSLGNIVSGRGYALRLSGGTSHYPVSLVSPLLSVNHEARRAALSFYHVRLPFPGPHMTKEGRILYLNAEYDVICVGPRQPDFFPDDYEGYYPRVATVLVDFLHDVKAHDPKGQGVAHLALRSDYLLDLFGREAVPLSPAILHPTAAASFTDMLRRTLRSVLCVVGFRHQTRGLGEFPTANWRYHFAQTFPLCRRGNPTGTFRWLATDPRPGVELDLRQLPLNAYDEPHCISQRWQELKAAFSLTNGQGAPQAGKNKDNNNNTNNSNRDSNSNDGPRLYICPTQKWPSSLAPQDFIRPGEEGSRQELARHLRFEEQCWLRELKTFTDMFLQGGTTTTTHVPPKKHDMMMMFDDDLADAETLETMERVPVTAVGMWVFPVEVFDGRQPTVPQRNCWDVSGVRPGLFLFDV
ncbi:uncharacterized protein B0T15DRAFT_492244 [Chaetomium strumarium]|uniref:2EXR domain-containing protein n=1 Tax=Chaetomium strumarium TaxID=1170767 RepID=A0AAJ0GVF2_9PEZI|nr:hypothetical protein B0T15DRAFT_492244 [Chaetomium strumarium]